MAVTLRGQVLAGSAALGALSLALTPGCQSTEAVLPPSANAGQGGIVTVGETVTLDGRASLSGSGEASDALVFEWTLNAPAGSAAQLSDAAAPEPSFVADTEGAFVVQLVVVEGEARSLPDVVVFRSYRPLAVTLQIPPDRAVDVVPLTPVVVVFSEPVQPESVTEDTFYVHDSGALIDGALELTEGNRAVVFRAAQPLPTGHSPQVVVTQRVVSLRGFTLPAAYQGVFAVGGATDVRRPEVCDTVPADGAVAVPRASAIEITFCEPIDLATIDATSVQLRDGTGALTTAREVLTADARALLVPSAALNSDTAYQIVVTTAVTDLAGNPLDGDGAGGDFVASFQTATGSDVPPVLLAIYPGAGFDGIPLGASVSLWFSQALQPASITAASVSLSDGTGTLALTPLLSTGNRVVTLNPGGLTVGATYTLLVRGSGAEHVASLSDIALDGDRDGAAGGDAQVQFTATTEATCDGAFQLPVSILPGETVDVVVNDCDLNVTAIRDTLQVTSLSTLGETEVILLTETTGLSGVFAGEVATSFAAIAGSNNDQVFNVRTGDVLSFRYLDPASAEGREIEVLGSVDVAAPLAGVTVGAVSGNTSEAGADASFTLVLEAQPTAAVTLSFAVDDASEGSLSVTNATFTTLNWGTVQTISVNGVDDDVADGDQTYHVVFGATTSTDGAYASITPATIDLVNLDDDIADINVGTVSGPTTEFGGTATFTVVLTSEPTAAVVLGFDSNDLTEGTVDVTSLTFNASDWDQAQTVTITGVDDGQADGPQTYEIVFSSPSTSDALYALVTPLDVVVTNSDDDTAGFVVTTPTGLATEAGGSATFEVSLASLPTSDVTLAFDSSDLGEATLGSTTLLFTTLDWNIPQPITATGVNDDVDDGDVTFQVVFGATTSLDANYAAIRPDDVGLLNEDDDTAGFALTLLSGDTTEAGGTATFDIELTSEPTAPVQLLVGSDRPSEGTVTATPPLILSFTAANWDSPHPVTATGVDDDIDDGDQGYLVEFLGTASLDPNYAALTPSDVAVTNLDDDSAGISVGVISGDTTEAGGTATFDVVLDSEPVAAVDVSFTSSDTSEGTVPAVGLTFTAADWDVPQTVTVTGVNDVLQDGDIAFTIDFDASTSADPNYVGLVPASVAVSNAEVGVNGVPAIEQSTFRLGRTILVRVSAETDEYGNATVGPGNDTVQVSLNSATTGDLETLIMLPESQLTAGTFDCTVHGCTFRTEENATAVPGDGLLQATASETVTLTYVDALRDDGTTAVAALATATALASDCVDLVINEVVSNPQQDWNDTTGGDSLPFNATVGTGTIDTTDEWIELFNAGCTMNLTNFTLAMIDGSPTTYEFGVTSDQQVLVFSLGGDVANFQTGEYLVLGNPSGAADSLDDDLWLHLDGAAGGIIDEVAFGTAPHADGDDADNAPTMSVGDDSVARTPDGVDTDADDLDWSVVLSPNATPAAPNP